MVIRGKKILWKGIVFIFLFLFVWSNFQILTSVSKRENDGESTNENDSFQNKEVQSKRLGNYCGSDGHPSYRNTILNDISGTPEYYCLDENYGTAYVRIDSYHQVDDDNVSTKQGILILTSVEFKSSNIGNRFMNSRKEIVILFEKRSNYVKKAVDLSQGKEFLSDLKTSNFKSKSKQEFKKTYYFYIKLGWVSSWNVARQRYWQGFFILNYERFLSKEQPEVKIRVKGVKEKCSNPNNCNGDYQHYRLDSSSTYEGGSLSLFSQLMAFGFSVAGGEEYGTHKLNGVF